MKKALSILGGIAVAAVATGIALGGIPGSGGVISGCYHKQLGVLRVYDAEGTTPKGCASWERSISWSQTGPQGPAGTPGAAGKDGAAGQDGERGPSEAFTVFSSEDTTLPPGSNAVVASLTLPAGSFLLTGSVQVADSAGDNGALGTCGFELIGWEGAIGSYDFPNQHQAIFSFTGVTTLTGPGAAGIRCRNDGPDDVIVRVARASAVQVGTLTVQP